MTEEKASTVFDFDPTALEARPEDKIKALMEKVVAPPRPQPTADEPEFQPEPYTPADMLEIVQTVTGEGYTNLDAANRALRIMLAQSGDLLDTFDEIDQVIGQVDQARAEAITQRDRAQTESKGIALAMRELISLILDPNATDTDVVEAAHRCSSIAEQATAGIEEYDGNMINIAINLRALNDFKSGPLRGLGTEPRKRVLYLTNAAAAILDDARVNMLALKEAAQGLVNETVNLRAQMETLNAVADKPETVN